MYLEKEEIRQNHYSWSQVFEKSIKYKQNTALFLLLLRFHPDSILYNFSLIFSCMSGKHITPKHSSHAVDPLKRDASLPNRANGNVACYISQTLLFHVGWGVCGNLIRLHYLKSQWSKLISHLPSVRDHLHLALEWRLELFPHLSCCNFSLFVLFLLCTDAFNSL